MHESWTVGRVRGLCYGARVFLGRPGVREARHPQVPADTRGMRAQVHPPHDIPGSAELHETITPRSECSHPLDPR